NSDTKSKLLSPTSTQVSDDPINDSIDDEPELERRMSLVPKVESGKLDGKRAIKNTIKRKTSRSLSMDSAARSPTISSGFGFGVGIGISSGRAAGQSQHFRPYLKESVAAKSTTQRPRAMSISASNGAKKTSVATTTLPRGTGQTLISKRLSIGGNSKYIWMGKMGNFKMISDDDELSNERKDDHINEEEEDQESEGIETDESAQKRGVNSSFDQSATDMSRSCDVELSTEQVCDAGSTESNQSDQEDSLPQSPVSASLEREENFLRQLGWQKPYDNDDSQWAITEEEKRLFINLVCALNGISVNERNGFDSEKALSNGEIN
ncbi:3445_t:CDS:1, partial [Acaulospora morrowiae]